MTRPSPARSVSLSSAAHSSFGRLLRHHKFRNFVWRPLPQEVATEAYYKKYISENTVAVHWVGRGQKEAKMAAAGIEF